MQQWRSFRFQLHPTVAATTRFMQFVGDRRWVFNKGLELQLARLARGETLLSVFDLMRELAGWRMDPGTAWLRDGIGHSQREGLKDLAAAVQRWRKTGSKLRFKQRGKCRDSFRCPAQFVVDEDNARIRLPKIGWVRYRKSREISGTPKQVTVYRDGTRWFVVIVTAQTIATPSHPKRYSDTIGIDAGVANFATLSNGEVIPPINAGKGIEQQLARLQRKAARQVKGSNNQNKTYAKIAKLQRKAANRRADFTHKLSTRLCKNHAMIVVEDLNLQNMTKSAKGTVVQPGKNVRQKAGLNKAILDQGFSMFWRQLEYKQQWLGGKLVRVPPAYTSQRCWLCGHIDTDNRRSQSEFVCTACGYAAHADLNAAKNILEAGLALTACGGSRGPEKQEPTSAERQLEALAC